MQPWRSLAQTPGLRGRGGGVSEACVTLTAVPGPTLHLASLCAVENQQVRTHVRQALGLFQPLQSTQTSSLSDTGSNVYTFQLSGFLLMCDAKEVASDQLITLP